MQRIWTFGKAADLDVLLDTHAWVWSLTDDPRLSVNARTTLAQARTVFVSPISFFEIGQKVRIGKWPEMELHLQGLPDQLAAQGGQTAAFTNEIALEASLMNWAHRDPFDRIIGATAMLGGLLLVSADTAFDTLIDQRLHRTW